MCRPDIALEAELGSIGGKEDDVGPEHASTPTRTRSGTSSRRSAATCSRSRSATCTDTPRTRASTSTCWPRSARPARSRWSSTAVRACPTEQLGRLHEFGVVKVNVASDLRNAMIRTFGEAYAANPNEVSLIRVSKDAVAAIADVVERRIRILNPSVA